MVLRTRLDGCWDLRSNPWGTFLAPVPDPLADTVITKEQKEGFEIKENIDKIPSDLWTRWIKLCFEMMKRGVGSLEVSCRLLRNIEDPSMFRIVVPEQQVSGASVRVNTFDKSIDISTGEVIEQYPPEGWRPCGSSHSHNTMGAFFSGTDDQYELGDPGLHIVVGQLNPDKQEYTPLASVTANKTRYEFETIDTVVDTTWDELATYHPSVLEIIKTNSYSVKTMRYISTFNPPMWQDDDYCSPMGVASSPTLKRDLDFILSEITNLFEDALQAGADPEDFLFQIEAEIQDLRTYGPQILSNTF